MLIVAGCGDLDGLQELAARLGFAAAWMLWSAFYPQPQTLNYKH